MNNIERYLSTGDSYRVRLSGLPTRERSALLTARDLTRTAHKDNAPLLRPVDGEFAAFLGFAAAKADMHDNTENQPNRYAHIGGPVRQGPPSGKAS